MRVPLTWLREYVDLPADVTARDLATRLTLAGLEVETVDELGSDISGPIVYGRVLEIEELTGFKKPIRHCEVDVGQANGTGEPQEIVCGARNFSVGDLVVVSLPGAELPGGFRIGARKTYGKMSAGMICSATELGLWEDHEGIVVLPEGFGRTGDDAIGPLGLREDVLDIAVTPDRGYALSMRGVARDVASLYGLDFHDPADVTVAEPTGEGQAAGVDPALCDRYVLRGATGFDPDTPSPLWMKRRLHQSGVRPISLAVDVTNYVMLELGQPLHAWDRSRLKGGLHVRAAAAGEKLETLDHVQRVLDGDDIVIADESGPINIAGVMGGLTTEISLTSTEVLIEAGHFDAMHLARSSRRHQLSSESSRRFERGIDSAVQLAAATRAVELLSELGGATVETAYTHIDETEAREPITLKAAHPGAVAGIDYPEGTTERWLRAVGCAVEADGDALTVTPPTWRPDLTDPNDLAEEVIRLEGYENIPSIPPRAPAGRGLTSGQRLRRAVGRTLADAGYNEVLSYPFVGERDLDGLQLEDDDARRVSLRLANPLNDEEPLLRTTLLPGLFKALARNVGRGFTDVALFEMGLVYRPRPGATRAPLLPVDRGPSAEEFALIDAAVPDQPRRVGAVMAGNAERAGWWGPGRPASWADAVQAARDVARVAGVELEVEADQHAPWHPGRCAALYVREDGERLLVGHAGELHPRTVKAFALPERSVAVEVDLDRIESVRTGTVAPEVSTYPVATQDVALSVNESVPVDAISAALAEGVGELLESVRLFDVYTGEQVEEGRKSVAFTLRFRASDRTLTAEETSAARDAAVALAGERTGATPRT